MYIILEDFRLEILCIWCERFLISTY